MTKEIYDGMASALLPLLVKRAGFVAHATRPIEGGWQLMEIWESEEQHEAWANDVVLPNLPAGMDPPEMTTQPLYNVVTAHGTVNLND